MYKDYGNQIFNRFCDNLAEIREYGFDNLVGNLPEPDSHYNGDWIQYAIHEYNENGY